jgi:DNA-binding CsgD family transcriptional regulator
MRIDDSLAARRGDGARLGGNAGDCMSSLSPGDYRHVLELVAEALRCAGPDFPDRTLTGFLCAAFDAEFAGAGDIDLRGSASRRWADVPGLIPTSPVGFHQSAVNHPVARAHQRPGGAVPLRLSDVASAQEVRSIYDEIGLSRLLTIPLAVTPQHICAVVLLRSGSDFPTGKLQLARELHPVLSGIYALRDRIAPQADPGQIDPDSGIPLTARELAVLDLMTRGLIAAAIARRLGISSRTVSKHIENIYRKLDTHDRTSAVLSAQAMGFLSPSRR